MKYYTLTLAAALLSIILFSQKNDAPAMARFAKIKSYSEAHFKIWFSNENISATFTSKSGLSDFQLHKLKRDSLEKAIAFIEKYNNLKDALDELIVQLKGDMVLTNSRKRLKQLNAGIQEQSSWYGKKFTEIKTHYDTYVQEFVKGFDAASIPDITGIFTALTGLVTSARDHRLEKVKLLNEQLEGLRLKPYYELLDEKKKE